MGLSMTETEMKELAAAVGGTIFVGVRQDGTWFAGGYGHEIDGSNASIAVFGLKQVIAAGVNGKRREAESALRDTTRILDDLEVPYVRS